MSIKELYIGGDLSQSQYTSRKTEIEYQIQTLVRPQTIDYSQAVNMLKDFSKVWHLANEDQRKRLAEWCSSESMLRANGLRQFSQNLTSTLW
jgi:hypothetical protein